jgi:hypothetical protein
VPENEIMVKKGKKALSRSKTRKGHIQFIAFYYIKYSAL